MSMARSINSNMPDDWDSMQERDVQLEWDSMQDEETNQNPETSGLKRGHINDTLWSSVSDNPEESAISASARTEAGWAGGNILASPPMKRTTLSAYRTNVQKPFQFMKARNSTLGAVPKYNRTLSSTPGHTFKIKPLDVENNQQFSRNPIKVATALKAHPFCKLNRKDVRINQRRNIVAIEVNEISSILKIEILSIENFSGFAVKIFRPKSETEVLGVIGPIDPSVDDAELAAILKADRGIAITNVVRLFRYVAGNRTPSLSVKLTFDGDQLPRSVSVDMIHYQVREYDPPPLRCYRCQRYEHTASGCTSKMRWMICSGNHNRQE